MRRGAIAVAIALTVGVVCGGCGGADEPAPTTTTTTSPKPPPREVSEPLPGRPREWRAFANERGGYALLLPRGWRPDRDGPRTLIRSFDRLVALSIVPDREPASLATSVADYAANTAAGLRGFEGGLWVGGSRAFSHRYEGAEVFGRGRSRAGVRQRASVIVLRRGELATITVVLAAGARPAARESVRLARRAIRTIRTRPPRSGRAPAEGDGAEHEREDDRGEDDGDVEPEAPAE